MNTVAKNEPMPRMASARQFLLGAAWVLMSAFVSGMAASFVPASYTAFFVAIIQSALLFAGFTIFSTVFDRQSAPTAYIGLPRRSTTGREWLMGLALGWGIVTIIVLPMVLLRSLCPAFDFSVRSWNLFIVQLASAAAVAFAEELAFRGYAFQRLTESIGEAWGTVAVCAIFGFIQLRSQDATIASVAAVVLLNLLCCVAYLRTRGLWLGWGLRFGWFAVSGILFGLPIDGDRRFNSVVTTSVGDPVWLTGGILGPIASAVAPFVLLAGIVVLVRVTRDLAWDYNFRPAEGAGYPMSPPPPPEHARMEEEAKAKMSALIQIAPLASSSQASRENDDHS